MKSKPIKEGHFYLMIKNHKAKRLFLKMYILYKRYMDKDDNMERSPYEKDVIGICRTMIQKKNSKLKLGVTSGKRYVENHELGVLIIIQRNLVEVMGDYSYPVSISPKTYYTICNIFDGYVEMDRESMETKYRNKVKHSLEDMHLKLKCL